MLYEYFSLDVSMTYEAMNELTGSAYNAWLQHQLIQLRRTRVTSSTGQRPQIFQTVVKVVACSRRGSRRGYKGTKNKGDGNAVGVEGVENGERVFPAQPTTGSGIAS